MKFLLPTFPHKPDRTRMQRVVRQDELRSLLVGQPILNQRQVQILVASVNLVADDRMTEMRKVDANLVFSSGAGHDAEQGEG